MMHTKLDYSRISIIYNPNSTGSAPSKAKKLYGQLQKRLVNCPVELIKTKQAGHAEELAYRIAKQYKNPLIVSVSGDGGYNEVINGAMRAAEQSGAKPICSVYAAGNANDHRRTVKENSLPQAVADNKIQAIDLLKIEVRGQNQKIWSRYAHSYIGLGITPAVAVELNRHSLNRWKETLLLIKTYIRFKPFFIEVEGTCRKFDSLVLANINQMAKMLTISQNGRPDDGQFEVITVPHRRRLTLLVVAIKAAVFGLGPQPRHKNYTFRVIQDTPLQLDGEVKELVKGDMVKVSIAPKCLRTIM